MFYGVHARPEVERVRESGNSTAQEVVLVTPAGDGPVLDPWPMAGRRALEARDPKGRATELGALIPMGTILVGYDALETERQPLYETLMALESKVYCFDGFTVDIAFLDELSEFIAAKRAMGEWVQVILEAPVPTDKAGRDDLMELASAMSVSTSEGVIEDGRQMALVLGQFDGAAAAFAFAYASSLPGETIEGIALGRGCETELHLDWLGCYAEAGIIGFQGKDEARAFHAVNLVQGDSPYRQMNATRVLQWYLADWHEALRLAPGESMDLGLYEVQRITEELLSSYEESGHIDRSSYEISFSALSGLIECETVLYPFYGVEGISGVGVARTQKG